jgi:hypothetical protein
MKGYKGKVAFTKSIKYGDVSAWCDYMAEAAIDGTIKNHVFLAVIEVDIEFQDTREKENELIQKEMENERAESQQRLNMMMGRIQQLQALEHD